MVPHLKYSLKFLISSQHFLLLNKYNLSAFPYSFKSLIYTFDSLCIMCCTRIIQHLIYSFGQNCLYIYNKYTHSTKMQKGIQWKVPHPNPPETTSFYLTYLSEICINEHICICLLYILYTYGNTPHMLFPNLLFKLNILEIAGAILFNGCTLFHCMDIPQVMLPVFYYLGGFRYFSL